jgi:pimeloyl-ACP methyl ester carboxylesterase
VVSDIAVLLTKHWDGGGVAEERAGAIEDVAAPDDVSVPGRQAMRPVYVGGCFGWLHMAGTGAEVAVMICPGLTRDRLDAHRGLRLLADALARDGYPALRIDYPGTGDAADTPDEPWSAWQDGLRAALDWLRDATGARRLVLVGLRVGATLATLAAQGREDVAALALLAPVLRGRSYMQQLQMEVRLQRGESAGGGLELHELRLDQASVELVSRVELKQARLRPGTRVGMFLQAPSRPASDCAEAWSGQGSEVALLDFAGLDPLLRHNEASEGTPPDFTALLAWLRQAAPPHPAPLPTTAPFVPALAGPGWVETPMLFGEGLVGLLCGPAHPAGDLAVLIVNTGRDPRYGVGRFGVEFARHLAALGVASLRFDFAGLGDSRGRPGKEDVLTAMFDATRGADIRAAVDLLEQLGYRRVALHGNCSGAFHALHAAVDEPRVAALLLVNLPVFEWQTGDTPDFMHRRTMKPGLYLLRLAWREEWAKLLRGRLNVREIVHAQSKRAWQTLRGVLARAAERYGLIAPQSAGRRALRRLAQRNVRTLFLFAHDDNGIDALEQEFGRGGAGLSAYANATLHIEPGLDHLLSTGAMRQAAIGVMARYLIGQRPPESYPLPQECDDDDPRYDSDADGKHRAAAA